MSISSVRSTIQEKNCNSINRLNQANFDFENEGGVDLSKLKDVYGNVAITSDIFEVSKKTYKFSHDKFNEIDSVDEHQLKKIEFYPTVVSVNKDNLQIWSTFFSAHAITIVVKKYIELKYLKLGPKVSQQLEEQLFGLAGVEQTSEITVLTERNSKFVLLTCHAIGKFINESAMTYNGSTFTFDFLPAQSRQQIFQFMGANPKFNSPLKVGPVNEQNILNNTSLIFVYCNIEQGSILEMRGEGEGCPGLGWGVGVPFIRISDTLWVLATPFTISKAKAKFVKVAQDGTVLWEKGENRTFTSDAIQTCVPQIEGAELPSVGIQGVQKVPLIIKFKADAQDKGEVMLRGEGEECELSWHKGMRLIPVGQELFVCEIASSFNEKIVCKVVKEYPENIVHWETSANRSFTLGQKPIVLDALNITFAP